jgi:hypothetical protein
MPALWYRILLARMPYIYRHHLERSYTSVPQSQTSPSTVNSIDITRSISHHETRRKSFHHHRRCRLYRRRGRQDHHRRRGYRSRESIFVFSSGHGRLNFRSSTYWIPKLERLKSKSTTPNVPFTSKPISPIQTKSLQLAMLPSRQSPRVRSSEECTVPPSLQAGNGITS